MIWALDLKHVGATDREIACAVWGDARKGWSDSALRAGWALPQSRSPKRGESVRHHTKTKTSPARCDLGPVDKPIPAPASHPRGHVGVAPPKPLEPRRRWDRFVHRA
jgi:hypothetical protein